MDGMMIFVTGGSTGLGKEIAKAVAAQGAHVTIFARRQKPLEEAKAELLASRKNGSQEINAVSVDLSDSTKVDQVFRAQTRLADVLYCSAGGCQTQCGYLTEITPHDLESCMRNNYFTAAFSSQVMLKIWTEQDKKTEVIADPTHRRIVFINSAGAFVGLPGYTAYTPSKTAVRALADTLRMEALLYSTPMSRYTVQCAFPSNIYTEAFFEEQKNKPELTKKLEGTAGDTAALQKKLPTAQKVANYIVSKGDSTDFAICDSTDSSFLFANMVGPSPKRGLGIVDSFLAVVVQLIVWPLQRRQWDSMCVKDGK